MTRDATGTMVMLELQALGLGRACTQVSVQYVDHNLLQADEQNMADHLFLRLACHRFGLWYSKPGTGVAPRCTCSGSGAGRVAGLGLAHVCRRVAGHAGHRDRRP